MSVLDETASIEDIQNDIVRCRRVYHTFEGIHTEPSTEVFNEFASRFFTLVKEKSKNESTEHASIEGHTAEYVCNLREVSSRQLANEWFELLDTYVACRDNCKFYATLSKTQRKEIEIWKKRVSELENESILEKIYRSIKRD